MLAPGLAERGFRLDPAGRFVLYTADQDEEDVHELYLAPLPRLRERAAIR